MMSDDHRFVGLNLNNRRVADNSEATGRAFAAALDLMVKGLQGRDVLVLGCGPVGLSAARALLFFGARVTLYDRNASAAEGVKACLSSRAGGGDVVLEKDPAKALAMHRLILEATPEAGTIPDGSIFPDTFVAAPGVPLGVSASGREILRGRLVHDKLELGVAAMAVSLLLSD